jgi:hypothetical protein
MRTKFYVGLKQDATREVFRAASKPTHKTHGRKYAATIGPFRTKRAAEFMAKYGQGNPHLQTVADAERISKWITNNEYLEA